MSMHPSAIHVEALDDLPILIAALEQLDLPALLGQVIGTHGTTQRYKVLTNASALLVWLLFLLTQGDHRKYTVASWVAQHQQTLEALFRQPIAPEECSDDRLSTILTRLADPLTQETLDGELATRTIHVYLPMGGGLLAVHLDATTTYGFHQVTPDGLMQLGRGKDGPRDAPNVKLMAATVGAGHYLTGEVVPGSAADDPLYVPVLTRTTRLLPPLAGPLLFVGDAKFAAQASRASCQAQEQNYLTVLSLRHEPAGTVAQWVEEALAGDWPGPTAVWKEDTLLGYGYARTREQIATVAQQTVCWTERLLLFWSAAHAAQQSAELRKRLATARKRLAALQGMPTQGRTAYRTAAALQAEVDARVAACGVTGLLTVTLDATEVGEEARYRVAAITEDAEAIRQAVRRLGWRVYLTNADAALLAFDAAIHTYRGVPAGVERFFHLLKGRSLGLHPLFVHTDPQIRGLLYLLTLAARVLTYLEGVVRQSLQTTRTGMTHLILNNLHKAVEKPTIRQMLEAVCRSSIALVTIHEATGEISRHLTPIPEVVEQIIVAMGLPPDTYRRLVPDQASP